LQLIKYITFLEEQPEGRNNIGRGISPVDNGMNKPFEFIKIYRIFIYSYIRLFFWPMANILTICNLKVPGKIILSIFFSTYCRVNWQSSKTKRPMKKTILFTILILINIIVHAQVSQRSNYLADNTDGQDAPIISPKIQMSDSITAPTVQPNTIVEQKTQFRRNAIYFEFGGQGILYSINYECRIRPHIILRAGFSSWSIKGDLFFIQIEKFEYTAFPLMVNYLTGVKQSSHLEVGVGMISAFTSGRGSFLYMNSNSASESLLIATASLGYRYQPKDGGFVFRAVIAPIINNNDAILTAGFSFGIGF